MVDCRFGSRVPERRAEAESPSTDADSSGSERPSSPIRARRRSKLLFALSELEYPTSVLRRVAAVATALDGDLYILRVLAQPCPPTSHSLAHPDQPGLDGERSRLARCGTAAWWKRTLLRPFDAEHIEVRVGDFANEVSAHARALGVACVILAPAQSGCSGTMTALLRACRQPVFATPDAGQQWAALLAAAKATAVD